MTDIVVFLTDTTATTWTIPSNWTNTNHIEAIGGGNGGQSGGYGGGGGAYARINNFSSSPGNVINIQVGKGGIGNSTGVTSSWFNNTSTLLAEGAIYGSVHNYLGGTAAGSVGTVKYDGGAGGNDGGSSSAEGGNGGGGAAGPNGPGKAGGKGPATLPFFVVAGGGGGGGSGGGTAGSDVSGAGSIDGGNGGNNFAGSGQGIGGIAPNTDGTPGANGGGGGGAFGSGGPSPPYNNNNGGNGGNGTEWTSTLSAIAGAGGGGGSACSGYSNFPGTPSPGNGGNGGLYGAGGGAGKGGTGALGNGAQGIIVVTYTPSSPPPPPAGPPPYREFEDLEEEPEEEIEDTFQPRVFANVVHPCFSTPALWRTDVEPSSLSSYVECEPMEWIYQTVLLPDNLLMAENCVIETNLAMAFLGSLPTVTCEAFTSNDFVLGTLTIPSPDTDTIWGQFLWGQAPWGGTESNISEWRVAWTEPLIFKQMTFKASGQSTGGFKIGNLYLKYQILGYRQQQGSGDR